MKKQLQIKQKVIHALFVGYLMQFPTIGVTLRSCESIDVSKNALISRKFKNNNIWAMDSEKIKFTSYNSSFASVGF